MSPDPQGTDYRSLMENAFAELKRMRSKLKAIESEKHEPIAIIGMACRFPDSSNLDEYWRLLRDGIDAIGELPAGRWPSEYLVETDSGIPGSTRFGGFIDGIDKFDAGFFDISPREAAEIDPQQRLLLEVAWEAIEHAAQSPHRLKGSSTGCFIGLFMDDYSKLGFYSGESSRVTAYNCLGNLRSMAAGRLAYVLGVHGPAIQVDTACSSSLLAVHLACQSLRLRESDTALAGGVNLMLIPEPTLGVSRLSALSTGGRCKTFSAEADGYVRGEGCGIVVLKRLSDALANGDNILALVRGSAVNHDGRSNGLTAPNGAAQEAVINAALRNALVKPSEIQYVETHGTGTLLGDPIEVMALSSALCQGRTSTDRLAIGSVKTNIGHLESAAGVAALIKVVLAMQHRQIPPSIHFKTPNPHIPWERLPVDVAQKLAPWPDRNGRRFAGVSAFGMSGTNVHVVVQDAQSLAKQRGDSRNSDPHPLERPLHLLTLSARSDSALRTLAQRYADYLRSESGSPIADICFTANIGRAHFEHRLAIVAESRRDLGSKLNAAASGKGAAGAYQAATVNGQTPKVAFLFTGQGSQYGGMGRELYDTQPAFRRIIDECDSFLDKSLLPVLFPEPPGKKLIDETAFTQPALLALEYALAELWRSWGVEPAVLLGHSIGEYAAACVAGVFSLEDGLKLVAERGRLIQLLAEPGSMAAVFADESRVREAIGLHRRDLSIAAINGRRNTVISGNTEALRRVCDSFEKEGIRTEVLNTSHAFHSELMRPVVSRFEPFAAGIEYNRPAKRMIPASFGREKDAEAYDASYWSQQMVSTVRFAESILRVCELGCDVLIEIGPKPTLLSLAREAVTDPSTLLLPSLRQGRSNWSQMLDSLAKLYLHGAPVNWSGFDGDHRRTRIVLPGYPFERQRHWLESTAAGSRRRTASSRQPEPVVEQAPAQDWLYETVWREKHNESERQPLQDRPCLWLIFADAAGFAEQLGGIIAGEEGGTILVSAAEAYERLGPDRYAVNPANPADFETLLESVGNRDHDRPLGIVHVWSLDSVFDDRVSGAESLCCESLLYLVQALARREDHARSRLWLLTRGGQAITARSASRNLMQASVCGLGRVIAREHPELHCVLLDLDPWRETGQLQQAADELNCLSSEPEVAFRGDRRYVRRLVRSSQETSRLSPIVSPDGAYLITGGLGGLGLEILRWLSNRGAGNLVLVGRNDPSEAAKRVIDEVTATGTHILTIKADVSDPIDAARLFAEVDDRRLDLRGVIHLAGVVDDGMLASLTWKRFEQVLAPKTRGAWNLHRFTSDRPLDFFVCFSSAASVLGNIGQASYAAANAFMDALIEYRRMEGLPGTTINWGPWSGAGMAARLADREKSRWRRSGISEIEVAEGLDLLSQIISSRRAQVTVLKVDWPRYLSQFSGGEAPRLYEEVCGQAGESPRIEQNLIGAIQGAAPGKRRSVLISHLRSEIAGILGLSGAEQVPLQRSLSDLGIDSLMAVELRTGLETVLGCGLSSTLVFDYPTVERLAEYLAGTIGIRFPETGSAGASR